MRRECEGDVRERREERANRDHARGTDAIREREHDEHRDRVPELIGGDNPPEPRARRVPFGPEQRQRRRRQLRRQKDEREGRREGYRAGSHARMLTEPIGSSPRRASTCRYLC